MALTPRANLQGLKVIAFESRRAVELAELIHRYGGDPFVVPSMREIALEENGAALNIVPKLEADKFDLLILMTGVGTSTLTQLLLTQFSRERVIAALQRVKLVARGPKPAAALKELGLLPAFSVPEPNYLARDSLDSRVRFRSQRKAHCYSGVRRFQSGVDGGPTNSGRYSFGIADPPLGLTARSRGASPSPRKNNAASRRDCPFYQWRSG